MAITIDVPQGEAALEEFIRFHGRVYSQHTAHWPAPIDLQLPPAKKRAQAIDARPSAVALVLFAFNF